MVGVKTLHCSAPRRGDHRPVGEGLRFHPVFAFNVIHDVKIDSQV